MDVCIRNNSCSLVFNILIFSSRYTTFFNVKRSTGKSIGCVNKSKWNEEAKIYWKRFKSTVVSHSGKLFSFGIPVIIIGLLLSVFQQFVGINVVLYYAPEIFKSMGSGTDVALLQTIIVGAVNLLFTVLAIMTVDKFGRKPLMMIGALGMAIAMFALGGASLQNLLECLLLIFMLVYVASFAMSWGPVVWVLLSEIFPNKIRGRAMALAVAAQWVSNYLVSWTFPMMDKNSYLVETLSSWLCLLDLWAYGCVGHVVCMEICSGNQRKNFRRNGKCLG